MNLISAVIITFNEEKNIGRCLDSLHGIADEILVIDSGSFDKTAEICIEKGVKVIVNKFEGHIEQKNFALRQAKYNHVLSLDADEVLSPELQKSILKVKEQWNADAYSMNRLNNYCGKWIRYCGWYPDRKIRLLDRRKGIWGGQNPHDKIIMENDAKVSFLKGDILHYTVSSISEHVTQGNKFSDIAAREMFKKGEKAGFLKVAFSPVLKFLRDYFFKLGFLDGFYGFVICMISAHSRFLKYAKLRALHQQK